MKSLSGEEIADYVKMNQVRKVHSLKARGVQPKLVILRNNDSPVITKYIELKQNYGSDIGVEVEDQLTDNLSQAIDELNQDSTVHGIIIQLPLVDPTQTDEMTSLIAPEKDVDGLNHAGKIFESATATAINWLLSGYDIDLKNSRIAIVGHGRLVGGPLEKIWRDSGYDVTVFDKGSDLTELEDYDVIVSATGVPHLINARMVRDGAVVVDAGTASEGGILVGDVDDAVRERGDLKAITPKMGGVGPLTVTVLFDHVLQAASNG